MELLKSCSSWCKRPQNAPVPGLPDTILVYCIQ